MGFGGKNWDRIGVRGEISEDQGHRNGIRIQIDPGFLLLF